MNDYLPARSETFRISSSRKLLVAICFVLASAMTAAGQIPGQKTPGISTPAGPTIPDLKVPPINPSKLFAAPLSVTMQPSGSGPFYLPGMQTCAVQSLRFDSSGGYAPIAWSYSGSGAYGLMLELVDLNGQPNQPPPPPPATPKPAGTSSRLLKFKPIWNGTGDPGFVVSTTASVLVTDGAGKKMGTKFEVRGTRACAAPSLTGASQAVSTTTPNTLVSAQTYTLQAANFDSRDNLNPSLTRETRAECTYPSGLRVLCLDGLRYNGYLGLASDHCPSATQCKVKVLNLEGSGVVRVRLFNPYGASGTVDLNVTFPSAVLSENQTVTLPATIASQPAVISGTPSTNDYMGEAAPACNAHYLVWRGVTFSEPSGRAKLTRAVTPGTRVAPSTMPQWTVAPGSNQLSLQVNYEVERRYALCPALVAP